ncbi:MAG TPA: hypothetical protein VG457_04775, partial [Planctomycetota bacterium]|nr:hypothetical protein [Planctomycetota bacterium]
MSTTAPPAAGTPPPAAAPAAPAPETKAPTGTPGAPGVSGEPKAPAATPDATKTPEPAAPTTLLGKKLPPADPAKAAAEAPKEGAEKPKAEEYEVALPKDSLLGADQAKAMTVKYRELGLTKDQAQALAEQTSGALKSYVDARMAEVQKTEAGWWKEVESNPKYGGANLVQSDKFATAALDKFFPGLKDELINSPYAAHPKLFIGLVELGK